MRSCSALRRAYSQVPAAALLCALGGSAASASAQEPGTIDVGANVHVSAARDSLLHDEVLIGAHPTDPRKMIACSIAAPTGDYALVTIAYTTADGGVTWTPTLTDTGPYSGDPVCVYGNNDVAYFGAIAYKLFPPVLRVYRSGDAGMTWSRPTEISAVPDRPYIAVDRSNGPFGGQVYVPFNAAMVLMPVEGGMPKNALGLLTSADEARSFGNPVFRGLFSDTASRGHPSGAEVLSDGTLAVLFKHFSSTPSPGQRAEATLRLHLSTDGGRTLSNGFPISRTYGNVRPEPEEVQIALIDGLPVLAVDASDGPFRDRLYVAWYDTRSGRSEILLSYSADQGRTWSPPRRINDDRERERGPGGERGPNHLMPTVAVNRAGVVGVAWYDRRNSPDGLGWDVRFSASIDGGETWLPSVQVSSVRKTGGPDERWTFEPESSQPPGGPISVSVRLAEWATAGHTAGLAARADGVFFPLWIDGRTGTHQVWTAPVTVHGTAVVNGSAALAELEDVSAHAAFDFAWVTVDSARSTLRATARLRNTSEEPLDGPLHVRVLSLTSPYADLAVTDANNSIEGEGAVWTFMPDDGGLAPGAALTRDVTISLRNVSSTAPGDTYFGELLKLQVRILGNPDR